MASVGAVRNVSVISFAIVRCVLPRDFLKSIPASAPAQLQLSLSSMTRPTVEDELHIFTLLIVTDAGSATVRRLR